MASGAAIIASSDDLLIEILSYLPIKSLLQFKCVSKHWLLLISSPYFSRRRYPYPYIPSGLFLYPFRLNGIISSHPDFIPLDASSPCPSLSGMDVLHSCNGLLITNQKQDEGYKYYVYNPTTQKSNELPCPDEGFPGYFQGMYLAYNPLKSQHYKIIGVWSSIGAEPAVQIKIFSSELNKWRNSVIVNTRTEHVNYHNGVYWNDAINWISQQEHSIYFNIEEEHIGELPMLPINDGHEGRPFGYFGESRGHLHLVELYGQRKTQFNVYEMKRDYSCWFVLYCVDLTEVSRAFPEMLRGVVTEDYFEFKILTLIREKRDEDSCIVLHVPGKIIYYHIANKSFAELQNIEGAVDYVFPWHGALGCIESPSFEYIESLSPVSVLKENCIAIN